jgi:hypothetical protein
VLATALLLWETVSRIHDILVWIRIREPMPLTNGSGSCYFRHGPSIGQQKINCFKQYFCLLLFEGTFTSFSKIKVQKKSQNSMNQGFSFFLTIFAWWWKDPDPDPYIWLMDPGPGGRKTCGSNGSGSGTLERERRANSSAPHFVH